jgi:hypothetical protein
MQLIPVKAAFPEEMVTSFADLLPGARSGQFLFPFGLDFST